MEVVIRGAFDEHFVAGGGYFGPGETTLGGTPVFSITAGAGEDSVARRIVINQYGDDHRLSVGTYAFELIDPSNPHDGIRFEFRRDTYYIVDRFAAEHGTLRILESSAGRIVGSFELQAFRFCREELSEQGGYVEVDGSCEVPSAAVEAAPRITVTGEFVVVPL